MRVKQIGVGEFGPIYEGITGNEAVEFLISRQRGEVRDALFHSEIGFIDLIWGETEYGLAKIVRKHPEAIQNLSQSIQQGKILDRTMRRITIVNEMNKQRSIVDVEFHTMQKTWVVTSYIPI